MQHTHMHKTQYRGGPAQQPPLLVSCRAFAATAATAPTASNDNRTHLDQDESCCNARLQAFPQAENDNVSDAVAPGPVAGGSHQYVQWRHYGCAHADGFGEEQRRLHVCQQLAEGKPGCRTGAGRKMHQHHHHHQQQAASWSGNSEHKPLQCPASSGLHLSSL